MESTIDDNLFLKLSLIYTREVWDRFKHIRGFTRPAILLNSIGVQRISRKQDNHYNFSITEGETRNICSLEDLKKYTRKEYDQTRFLIENIDTDGTFYDIGGYHGYHAILGSLGGKVYVFEPDPENIDFIEENMELNSEQDIELVKKPVWNEETEIEMDLGKKGKSRASKNGEITKQTIYLDQFAENNRSPDIIKIDVEGAEYQVLKGAEKVLDKHRPIIILEAHIGERLQELGGSMEKIESLLEEKDYNIDKKQRSGEIHVYAKPM
jgi:FkbM family methyltransferase